MMKLSVCIPVYNVAPFIEPCVRSLFGQTYEDIEYVFVDDCSPDDSISIVQRVLQDYPKRANQVRFLRHDTNRGVVAARMTALKAATGELVTYCDPDDWVDANLYARMVERLLAADADAVMCQACFETESASIVRASQESFCLSGEEALRQMDRIPGLSSLVLRMAKRELMNPNELECPDRLIVAEDMCLSVQILVRCRRLVHLVGGDCYHYRQHETSLSHGRDVRRFVSDHRRVFDVLTRRVGCDATCGIRRHLAKTVLYGGIISGALTKDEYVWWRRVYETLGGQWRWVEKSLWGQRLMKIADFSYALARLLSPLVRRKVNDYL